MRVSRLCLVVAAFTAAIAVTQAQNSNRVTPKNDVTTRVVVRESATSQSADRGTLTPGDTAELLGSVPNWFQVRLANGVEGFVYKRWTRIVPAGPTPSTDPTFTIDVVDVGTGLAVLVRGPDFTLVYDAGSNDDEALGANNRMLAFIRAVAPTLTTIDHLILSHPHTDHVLLMPDLLQQFSVRDVYDSGRVNDICGYRAFLKAVRDEPNVRYHTAVQNGGTRDYPFPKPKQCGAVDEPAETIQVPHSTRIDNTPIALGANGSMTVLYAEGATRPTLNENSLVVRLDLGDTRILLMGDSEAGGRNSPAVNPSPASIEGILLNCCQQALAADILIAAHHGSRTSSRQAFLNAVMASTYVVSSGPTKYQTVVLPDADIIAEYTPRGQVFRTDLDDGACKKNSTKIGPDSDNQPGGCDNVRIVVTPNGSHHAEYMRTPD